MINLKYYLCLAYGVCSNSNSKHTHTVLSSTLFQNPICQSVAQSKCTFYISVTMYNMPFAECKTYTTKWIICTFTPCIKQDSVQWCENATHQHCNQHPPFTLAHSVCVYRGHFKGQCLEKALRWSLSECCVFNWGLCFCKKCWKLSVWERISFCRSFRNRVTCKHHVCKKLEEDKYIF